MSARSFNLFEIGKTRCGTRGLTISFGPLAQLARASALQAGGRGFESHKVHNIVEEEVYYLYLYVGGILEGFVPGLVKRCLVRLT